MYTLNADTIDIIPVDYDWATGYNDDWDICSNLISITPRGDDYNDREEWEPMMNYYYPLPSSFEPDDYEEIYDLMNSCTIVEFTDGGYALALTGGGMDLSWEICETFINLGYYPPIHFCDLPKMSGRGTSEKDKQIIKFCKESIEIGQQRLNNKTLNLNDL